MNDEPKPFVEHLGELRVRLLVIAGLVACFFVVAFYFVDSLLFWLARPVGELVFLKPTEAFWVRLKLAFYAALFLSLPVILYEIWRFVEVALTHSEKRIFLRYIPFSYLLFCAGLGLAWWAVIPAAMRFLIGFSTPQLQPMISAEAYVGFVVWLALAFGVVFQLPIAVLLLTQLGIVTPGLLACYRRHVLVGITVLGAVLTPGPDIFSQIAMVLPTYLLYELSILLSRWVS